MGVSLLPPAPATHSAGLLVPQGSWSAPVPCTEGRAPGGPGLQGTTGPRALALDERAPDARSWRGFGACHRLYGSGPVLRPLGISPFIRKRRQRGFLWSQRVCPGPSSRCQQGPRGFKATIPPKGQGPASTHLRAICVLVLVLVLVLSPGLLTFAFPGATATAWLFAQSPRMDLWENGEESEVSGHPVLEGSADGQGPPSWGGHGSRTQVPLPVCRRGRGEGRRRGDTQPGGQHNGLYSQMAWVPSSHLLPGVSATLDR